MLVSFLKKLRFLNPKIERALQAAHLD